MPNRIVIDWLTFSSKYDSISTIIQMLGLQKQTFISVNGRYGYKMCSYFGSISILYEGNEDMGVCCEISGQGCRTFENMGVGNWDYLFDCLLFGEGYNITRLDLAYDDMEEHLLDIEEICKDTKEENFVSKWNTYNVIYGNKGNSVTFGSRKSDIMLRIYDKEAEQKSKGIEINKHWIRVELQLRKDHCKNFVQLYLKDTSKIGIIYRGILYNYLRYIDVNSDSNKSRCNMLDYWFIFLENASRISLYSKVVVDYTIQDLENYVFNQAGNAIKTFIICKGEELFKQKLEELKRNTNQKYEKLKNDYIYSQSKV